MQKGRGGKQYARHGAPKLKPSCEQDVDHRTPSLRELANGRNWDEMVGHNTNAVNT